MNRQHEQEAWFDTWLDDRSNGSTTLPPDDDSMDSADLAALRSLAEGSADFHGLAARAERRDHPAAEQDLIWKRVLELQAKQPTSLRSLRSFRPGWSAVLSTLVAAVVLLAIVAGFRRFDFGSESGPGNLQFGSSGSVAVGEDFNIPFGEGGCTAEPMDREKLLAVLYAEPASRSVRSTTGVEFDEGTVSIQDVGYFASLAESFHTCLYLGRPMSALQMATEEFVRDWVMNQVVFTYGVVTREEVELFVDTLLAREASADREGFYPIGDTIFTPNIRVTEWLETTDGRIHLTVDWINQGMDDQAGYPANMPDSIVITRSEAGIWGIDRFGSDIVGG